VARFRIRVHLWSTPTDYIKQRLNIEFHHEIHFIETGHLIRKGPNYSQTCYKMQANLFFLQKYNYVYGYQNWYACERVGLILNAQIPCLGTLLQVLHLTGW